MPRPVDAVRTIKTWRLAAFDPQVIIQILLHTEHAAAIGARKALIASVSARSIVAFLRVPQHQLKSCKKKAHKTSFIKPVKIIMLLR